MLLARRINSSYSFSYLHRLIADKYRYILKIYVWYKLEKSAPQELITQKYWVHNIAGNTSEMCWVW